MDAFRAAATSSVAKDGVSTILGSASFHVGAGDVQLVRRHAICVFQDTNHLDVVAGGVPEDIRDNRGVILPKLRKLFGHKRADTDVLQADRVDHPARRLAHSRRRRSCHGLRGKTLHDDSAEAIQVHELREFNAITERATRRNDWVFEMDTADADSEVNPRGWLGDACPLWANSLEQSLPRGSRISARARYFSRRFRRCELAGTLC